MMKRVGSRAIAMVAAACLAAASAPAQAQNWSEQDILDGECITYFAQIVGQKSEEQADPGLFAIVGFFVGKVTGRHPGFDLTALLLPEMVNRVNANSTAVGQRCTSEAKEFGDHLLAAGEVLSDLGL